MALRVSHSPAHLPGRSPDGSRLGGERARSQKLTAPSLMLAPVYPTASAATDQSPRSPPSSRPLATMYRGTGVNVGRT